MQLIISSTRLIKLYISIYFVVILINNVSLSSGTLLTPVVDRYSLLKNRDGGFISNVDDNETNIKKSCIPCNVMENTMKTIKSLIIDLEHLNKNHCTANVDSLAQKSKDIQRQEMKPESYYRRYGRNRYNPPPHFPPPYLNDMYRIDLQTTTTTTSPSAGPQNPESQNN